jgi:hypothetical protein
MEGLSGSWEIGVVVGSILCQLLFSGGLLLLETAVKRERRKPTPKEWAAITSSRPELHRVLERRPQSSRLGNSHSPGPRVKAPQRGVGVLDQGNRAGAWKSPYPLRWYAGSSRGNLPPKGAA